jgi:hypothetical protein
MIQLLLSLVLIQSVLFIVSKDQNLFLKAPALTLVSNDLIRFCLCKFLDSSATASATLTLFQHVYSRSKKTTPHEHKRNVLSQKRHPLFNVSIGFLVVNGKMLGVERDNFLCDAVHYNGAVINNFV